MYIFVTPNIQSYWKSYSQYLSEFEKFIIHLPIWFPKKAYYRFLPFLFEWQNFKGLQQGFDDWHDSNWSSKGLWHNWPWLSFAKIICCWFLKTCCKLVSIYLSNRSFLVNLGNYFSQPIPVSWGVPQGSILGPLLFLIYVSDMSQAVKFDIFLYADDTCLVCQYKDINKI